MRGFVVQRKRTSTHRQEGRQEGALAFTMNSQAGASSSSISSSSFGGRNSVAESSATSDPSHTTNESVSLTQHQNNIQTFKPYPINSQYPHVPQSMTSDKDPFAVRVDEMGGNGGEHRRHSNSTNKTIQSAPANLMRDNSFLKQMGLSTTMPMDSTMAENDMTTPETQWGEYE